MPRIMAVDYGDARIGIALTDPLQIISSGYKTLLNNAKIYDNILEICKDRVVESIVIGIPFRQDNSIGDAAKKVLLFSKNLIEHLKSAGIILPVYEQDERYTTIEAHSAMRELKVRKKKKKHVVDQIAASRILSGFLNSSGKILLDVEKYLRSV